jgi:hypothetical protein
MKAQLDVSTMRSAYEGTREANDYREHRPEYDLATTFTSTGKKKVKLYL